MNLNFLISGPVGILPVLVFLGGLVYLDSFKLVRLRFILWMISGGGGLAVLTYFLNAELLVWMDLEFVLYARYVAPIIEELMKAAILIVLFRLHRVGFLVDGAILGFAIGAGFAVVENFYYLYVISDANLGVWVVRGFGTAIMHGGVTATFAILSQALMEKNENQAITNFLPGLAIAIIIHSVFNHFFLNPIFSAIAVILLLPPFMYFVFERSAHSLHEWLELDFDADADLIQQLNSGVLIETHVGNYLHELRERFEGMVIVDMLCYLRLYTELSMRAKGAMMMRQHGMEMPYDETIDAKFEEMRYLEGSIGKTGLLAIGPFLDVNSRDLWHLNHLEAGNA